MNARKPVRRLLVTLVLLLMTGRGLAGQDAGEPSRNSVSEAQMNEARAHFANGVELIEGNQANYQDAYHQFQLAYKKTGGSWKVAGNLGLCALKLERDGEALAFYTLYLKEGKDDIDPEERTVIERELLLIRGNLVTIELNFPEPGARVSVKRTGSQVAPQIYESSGTRLSLGLRAGELKVTATLGEKKESHEFTASPQDEIRHSFTFAEPPGQVAPTPVQAVEPDHSLRTVGWITSGVGAAVLTGGLVTGLLYQKKKKGAEEQCIGSTCPTSARSSFEAADQLGLMTNILLIGGAAVTLTGVSLVIVDATRQPDFESEQPQAVQDKGLQYLSMTPLLHPRLLGVSASGRF